ncbi:unnamed protein product [Mytilus coruscus]|uniref:CUB domain-containing protein n=1 Tax=Mytilus coruscus TaxID=42192 RepID=A0A6J7ZSF8_MYTCO|nr:unnamed protein product [Mytilus coruscus]
MEEGVKSMPLHSPILFSSLHSKKQIHKRFPCGTCFSFFLSDYFHALYSSIISKTGIQNDEMEKKDADCTIDLTATPYLQRFVSHYAYDGTVYYPVSNYSRDWLITGETANYTITIEFETCVLEVAKGVCLFDNIFIYDGSNSSAALLLQTCCGSANPPPFTVQSTDGTMYVLFSTDETIAREGFRVSYILQGAPTSTVSTTVQVAASTKEDNTLIYIIIACAVTAFLIIIIIILICVICCKKKFKAKKTKQKVHKKFGRSAPRPVVVTSESGSEAELEEHSESPRVVQTQQHSPPPAYATVVKEQNQNTIAQQNRGKSKQNNLAQNNNDKKISTGINSCVQKEKCTKVEKEKSIKVKKDNNSIKVEKENSIKVEKENSIKQTNEPNPIKELDAPTKKEAKASFGSKIKKWKKTDEISEEKKTVPTKMETRKTPGKLIEEEAKSTRASDIDNESDTKDYVKIKEKKRSDTKSEERNKRNVKSQIKDLDTSPDKKNIDTSPDKKDIDTTPDKKDIDTSPDKKDIDTTPDKKDIDTTPDKKDIDTTPDKKDIDTTPDKKVNSTEGGKVQKGKTDNRALDEQHVDIIKNDQQNSKISKSEKTKTIPKPHEYGLLDTEEISKRGKKTKNTNSGTEQIRTNENKEITNEIEKTITFKSPKSESQQKEINEDLKIEKKTVSNTISPISNKQNEETANTDKKEDKIKVETITHKNQEKIQSNKTRDNDKNNNRTEVHNKRLTYCEKQSVLTKSESSNDLFENEMSFFEGNEKLSNKIQKENEDSTQHNDMSMESKSIPRKLNVTSIDNKFQERPLAQEKKHEDYYKKSDKNTSRPDKAAKMVFNNTFFESLSKKPPKQTRQKQERKVIHSKNSIIPIESIENEKSDQVREDNKMETKKNQSDKNNQNNDKRPMNSTPEDMKENGDKPILSKSAPTILNFGTGSEQPKRSTNSTSDRFDDNSSIFTISSGATSNFKKSKERKRFRLSIKQYVPENKISQPKLNDEQYEERIKNLRSIYHSHSKHGHNERNIARARTQIDFEMQQKPISVKENPWLVQPQKDGIEIKNNQQVTKATVLRRMRTMGVQEIEDESIPDLIPKTQAFNILKMRTTVCDEDLAKSRRLVLPPLRGIPRQEPPDLPNLWRP